MVEKITEVDLGKKIIPWLERNGWEVYQEVQFRGYGGIADIVASDPVLTSRILH